ncbi:hypothetical protein CDD83_9604 [Cordyceps sp. RAO-2017]|nr:hypothetical protein CDD83_9604 [Cordyceps sp. RAO-2017]
MHLRRQQWLRLTEQATQVWQMPVDNLRQMLDRGMDWLRDNQPVIHQFLHQYCPAVVAILLQNMARQSTIASCQQGRKPAQRRDLSQAGSVCDEIIAMVQEPSEDKARAVSSTTATAMPASTTAADASKDDEAKPDGAQGKDDEKTDDKKADGKDADEDKGIHNELKKLADSSDGSLVGKALAGIAGTLAITGGTALVASSPEVAAMLATLGEGLGLSTELATGGGGAGAVGEGGIGAVGAGGAAAGGVGSAEAVASAVTRVGVRIGARFRGLLPRALGRRLVRVAQRNVVVRAVMGLTRSAVSRGSQYATELAPLLVNGGAAA